MGGGRGSPLPPGWGPPIPQAAQFEVSYGQKRELLGQSTPMKTGHHTTWQ